MKNKLGSKLLFVGIIIYTIAVIIAFDKGKFVVESYLIEQGKLNKKELVEFKVAQFAESTEAQIARLLGEDYITIPVNNYDFINFEELYQNNVENGDVLQFTLKGDKQGDITTGNILIKYGFRDVVDYYNASEIVTTEPYEIIEVMLTGNNIEGINKLNFIQERINTGDTEYTVQCKVVGRVKYLEEQTTSETPRTVISDNNEEDLTEGDLNNEE